MGFPLRDTYPGKAADTASSYGSHPAAMAEGEGVDSFCVLHHVHFEDFEDDLWPGCKLAAHFRQRGFTSLIQIPVNFMHLSFDFPQNPSTETAETP